MNVFYLIRHGGKIKEPGDPGLTDLGRKQSQKAGEFLKTKDISKIYSSTFRRAEETAEIIDNILKVGIEFDERLRERMNWGNVPDQTFKDFLKEWEYSNRNRDFKPESGISSYQAGKNMEDMVRTISKNFPDKNIVLATHGGVICDLLRNIFSDEEISKVNSEFPEKLDELIKECSITTLKKDGNRFFLESLGLIDYLTI